MTIRKSNFDVLASFELSNGRRVSYYSIPMLGDKSGSDVSRLPFSIRVVLESLLRNADGKTITDDDIKALADWNPKKQGEGEIPFKVSRILMQDFTGVPAVVDLTTMRDFAVAHGKDADAVQPLIPVDLIIDHSVQIDAFNTFNAIEVNQKKELERNRERYRLLKWAKNAFNDFEVYPPSAGICHQVNLEYLGKCVTIRNDGENDVAFPDTLVGTDSHTTMINGLGVVGFGVGGIEAEAAVLGQPVSFAAPQVIGVKLTGRLKDGVTATDFALTLTRLLREKGVVGKFVEFFGDGLNNLSLPDRATLSNMCPEYGATIAIFPPDEETLNYMRMTGRGDEQVELVRKYYEAQGMFGVDYNRVVYSDTLDVDLGEVVPSVSGPDQPKEQLPLQDIRDNFDSIFLSENGGEENENKVKKAALKYDDGYETILSDGDIVISSITSCTNTSNPSVMIAAGLLAKKAVERGLKVDTRKVKTSLAPGSRVVTTYLKKAGLLEYLERLGYNLVGYGCTTCIGNSGPLIDKQSDAINGNGLSVAAVLSGNRNFEARIHRDVHANYLMSPPLLIAFGIAGTVRIDLTKEPLGRDEKGNEVYLKDVWPSQEEINKVMKDAVSQDMFERVYGSNIYDVNGYWNDLDVPEGKMYGWDDSSTYIRKPPFFDGMDSEKEAEVRPIKNAAVLGVFGDSLSTDHISPAGAIGVNSPAGKYLTEHGVGQEDFNTYGSRRGNHEVMMRGTFANNRIKNAMLSGVIGGQTLHFPDGKRMPIYDAAMLYRKEGRELVVFGGKEYGSGSSRDWAAKGPALLGVRAVVARSFERIHRSNLIGMGVAPLQFSDGESADSLRMDFSSPVHIELSESMNPKDKIRMVYRDANGEEKEVYLTLRIDTQIELQYYKASGILNYVLRNIVEKD